MPQTNYRLVDIDSHTARVFQKDTCVAEFEIADIKELTKEEIEEIRVADYKELANG